MSERRGRIEGPGIAGGREMVGTLHVGGALGMLGALGKIVRKD